MKQFNLKEWLQDKSRKVVTREGKDVEIIYTNSPVPHHPIVGFIDKSIYTWTIDGKLIYGKEEQDKNDLFFADEEDELTEFEKVVQNILNEPHYQDIQAVKQWSKTLLDLARKELEKSIESDAIEFAKSYMEDVNPSFEKVQESEELWKWKMSCLRGINKAYTQGKQDALKDLPKWKKSSEHKDFQEHLAILEDNKVFLTNYLEEGDYYIVLNDLKTLPKEE